MLADAAIVGDKLLANQSHRGVEAAFPLTRAYRSRVLTDIGSAGVAAKGAALLYRRIEMSVSQCFRVGATPTTSTASDEHGGRRSASSCNESPSDPSISKITPRARRKANSLNARCFLRSCFASSRRCK